jgi:hypothetical protein
LLSSYIATGIDNVPIFIKADNAKNELDKLLTNLVIQCNRASLRS